MRPNPNLIKSGTLCSRPGSARFANARRIRLLVCSCLLLLPGTAARAQLQSQRVSLGINAVSLQDVARHFGTGSLKNFEKRVSLLSSAGYFRSLQGGLGFGLELGYGRVSESARSINTVRDYVYEERAEVSFREYYACPALQETIDLKERRIKFIAALTLPLSYIPRVTSFSAVSSRNNQSSSGSSVTDPDGSMFRLGLFLNAAVHRKLAGGWYAGLQLGAGGIYSRSRTEGARVSRSTAGTQLQYSEELIDQSQSELRFELRPMISLNHYF